jgi:hypothetical protein
MQEINELLKKYNLKPKCYKKNNKAILIETGNNKYYIKEKTNDNKDIYDYLKNRNFNYIPKIINNPNDEYEITEFIESYNIPNEQKIIDLINLVSLLHNKTTHYKEVTEDDYKEIYEDIKNNIEYLYGYYNDLISVIDTKVFMSPSEYLIARNISKIFKSLNFANEEIEKWYKLVNKKTKKRLVVLHNNLELDHFITNEKQYLINWDKAKIGIPIFDIFKLYKKHGLEYDFTELFKKYEKNYPLYEDERKLFFVLIALPPKLELTESEYEKTKKISKIIDMICKTERFISPYYLNERPKNNTHKQENKENIKPS